MKPAPGGGGGSLFGEALPAPQTILRSPWNPYSGWVCNWLRRSSAAAGHDAGSPLPPQSLPMVRQKRRGRWIRVDSSGADCSDHDHPDPDSAAACRFLMVWAGEIGLFYDPVTGALGKDARPHKS